MQFIKANAIALHMHLKIAENETQVESMHTKSIVSIHKNFNY